MRGSQRRLSGWAVAIFLSLAALLAIPVGSGIAALLHRGVMWWEERYMPMGEPPALLAKDVDTTFSLIGWVVSFVVIVAVATLLWYFSRRHTGRGTER